jgi:hypothetical protein
MRKNPNELDKIMVFFSPSLWDSILREGLPTSQAGHFV